MGGASPRPRPHPDFRLPASGLQNQQSMNRDATAFGHPPAPAAPGHGCRVQRLSADGGATAARRTGLGGDSLVGAEATVRLPVFASTAEGVTSATRRWVLRQGKLRAWHPGASAHGQSGQTSAGCKGAEAAYRGQRVGVSCLHSGAFYDPGPAASTGHPKLLPKTLNFELLWRPQGLATLQGPAAGGQTHHHPLLPRSPAPRPLYFPACGSAIPQTPGSQCPLTQHLPVRDSF